jgi:hypothetical protein
MIPLFTMMSGLIVAGFLVLSQSNAGVVRRKAADFRNFDGTETSTTSAPPGIPIWSKTIPIKPGEKVLYVTLSTTADTHFGAANWFSCNVDGDFCNGGAGGAAGAPAGWIALNKMPAPTTSTNCNDGGGGTGDCHDNRVYYSWCKVIEPPPNGPTTRTVNLRMASSDGTSVVFMEAAHFFIDVQQGSASGTDTPTCIQGNP